MSIKFIFVFIMILLVYGVANYYIARNLLAIMKKPKGVGTIVFCLLYILLALSPVLSRLITIDLLKIISDYWLFVFMYGFLLTIVGQIIYVVLRKRYKQVIGFTMVVTLILLGFIGHYYAFTPVVKSLEINRPEVSKINQLKIIVASDTHLGLLSNKKHLEKFVEFANKENPDLVILAGDVVDDSPKWFNEQEMDKTMRKLKTTYGVYAVLGNHEYIGKEIDETKKAMKKSNIILLQDETVKIEEGVYLTGRDDATNEKRKSLAQLRGNLSKSDAWIVVDHQPDKEMTREGVALMMSGHTHKGQLWPGNLMTNTIYPLDYGHLKKNNTDYVVTSGFGFWGPPMRIGTQSELWTIKMNFNR